LPAAPAICPVGQGREPFRLGRHDSNQFVKRVIKSGVIVVACVALKPFTALLASAYFLYLYYRHRPSTVDLLTLWLAVSPLMGVTFTRPSQSSVLERVGFL